MMQAVRGIYRGGVVELLEQPNVPGDAEVVVTFLTAGGAFEVGEDPQELVPGSIAEDAPPLDDFEPIVPTKPMRLSELVLEDRR
jgi:hypothetical protein